LPVETVRHAISALSTPRKRGVGARPRPRNAATYPARHDSSAPARPRPRNAAQGSRDR